MESIFAPGVLVQREGYASEVLQNQSDLNQVEKIWVMMFPVDRTNKLPGRGAEEQPDPEKG
jgi:hypothetical protein